MRTWPKQCTCVAVLKMWQVYRLLGCVIGARVHLDGAVLSSPASLQPTAERSATPPLRVHHLVHERMSACVVYARACTKSCLE